MCFFYIKGLQFLESGTTAPMSAVIFLFQKIQDPFAAFPVGAADGHLDHVIVGEEFLDLRIKLRASVAVFFQIQLWHHGRSLSFSLGHQSGHWR